MAYFYDTRDIPDHKVIVPTPQRHPKAVRLIRKLEDYKLELERLEQNYPPAKVEALTSDIIASKEIKERVESYQVLKRYLKTKIRTMESEIATLEGQSSEEQGLSDLPFSPVRSSLSFSSYSRNKQEEDGQDEQDEEDKRHEEPDYVAKTASSRYYAARRARKALDRRYQEFKDAERSKPKQVHDPRKEAEKSISRKFRPYAPTNNVGRQRVGSTRDAWTLRNYQDKRSRSKNPISPVKKHHPATRQKTKSSSRGEGKGSEELNMSTLRDETASWHEYKASAPSPRQQSGLDLYHTQKAKLEKERQDAAKRQEKAYLVYHQKINRPRSLRRFEEEEKGEDLAPEIFDRLYESNTLNRSYYLQTQEPTEESFLVSPRERTNFESMNTIARHADTFSFSPKVFSFLSFHNFFRFVDTRKL